MPQDRTSFLPPDLQATSCRTVSSPVIFRSPASCFWCFSHNKHQRPDTCACPLLWWGNGPWSCHRGKTHVQPVGDRAVDRDDGVASPPRFFLVFKSHCPFCGGVGAGGAAFVLLSVRPRWQSVPWRGRAFPRLPPVGEPCFDRSICRNPGNIN